MNFFFRSRENKKRGREKEKTVGRKFLLFLTRSHRRERAHTKKSSLKSASLLPNKQSAVVVVVVVVVVLSHRFSLSNTFLRFERR
jgi:hypothetical protein